jgi:hypothetical protein
VTEPHSPLDSALDLFVYVPVGLALTAVEELPKLAAKGRARVLGQIGVARVLGRFAVTQGRREVERRWNQVGGSPAQPDAPSVFDQAGRVPYDDLLDEHTEVGGEDSGGEEVRADEVRPDEPVGPEPTPRSTRIRTGAAGSASPDGPGAPPAANGLAIPGYDSLSASQVVQRLAGLASEELAAVGEYESSHRARRTVLTRVSQLQGG